MKNTIKILIFIASLTTAFYIGKRSERVKQSNEIVFVWEGAKSDIPEDGDQMINLATNENIIYLNPTDN